MPLVWVCWEAWVFLAVVGALWLWCRGVMVCGLWVLWVTGGCGSVLGWHRWAVDVIIRILCICCVCATCLS